MHVTGEGRATDIGSFLNPDDRESFAKSFGGALATERDLLTLLDMILTQSRRIASADAGSLYLVEKQEDRSKNGKAGRRVPTFPFFSCFFLLASFFSLVAIMLRLVRPGHIHADV